MIFPQFFSDPSLEAMLDLSDTGFEHFIEYVFQRAGYSAKFVANQHDRRGIDLELYSSINGLLYLAAIVQVKKYRNDVQPIEVRSLMGTLTNFVGAKGFLVSTSDFTKDAYRQAENHDEVCLLPGHQLLRYIDYVRETRVDGDQTLVISPEYIRRADTIQFRSISQTKVIAIANNKGSIGKTTTAINMAHIFDSLGFRVLVVDLDAQGNLSYRLPPRHDVVFNPHHFGNYLNNQCLLHDTIRQTAFSNIWLIPSHSDVRLIDPGANGYTESALKFARAIHHPDIVPLRHQTTEGFDWIILDTPTAVEFRIRLALAAAHYVIIPTQVETFAITGINLLQDTVEAMKALKGRDLKIAGALVTDYHGRGDPTGDQAFTLRNELANSSISIFKSTVHHHEGIEAAHRTQTNLFGGRRPNGRNAAAREYKAFVEELIGYVNSNDR